MAISAGRVTVRVPARNLPVMLLVVWLAVATGWTLLVDLEIVRPHGQWIPQQMVFLAVLIVPLVGLWQIVSPMKPTGIWALVAPLVGAYLVAHYYAFDVYDGPPYFRNSEAGDMPGWAILAGASVAAATGALTWFNRRLGVGLTVPVCLGCAVLIFFSNVFH
jgi:hypothetical protein